jgi:hypothetical protein
MENTFNLKKFLVENKLTSNSRILNENKELTPQEQEVVDDILNSVNEGMFDDMLEKVKKYARRGLITATVLTTLLGTPNLTQAQKQDIKDIAQIEMTSQQSSTDTAWEALKSDLKSTNPMLIVSKDADTGTPFQSLNWGTASNKGTGEKGALAIRHSKGSNVIEVTFFSRTNPEVLKQLVKNANEAGLKLTASYSGGTVQVSVPVAQASKLLQFIKTSTPVLQGAASQEKTGGSFDIGSNTGPMKAGPATTQAGSVKVGGKTFRGF